MLDDLINDYSLFISLLTDIIFTLLQLNNTRNEIDGYVVENNEQSLQRILLHLENDVSNEMLLQMGKRFKKNLNDEFNWDTIGRKPVVETYMDWISKEA